MKKIAALAVSFFIFVCVLEVGVRIVDSKKHFLIPPDMDYKGLKEYVTDRGYELFYPTEKGMYHKHPIRINSLGYRGPEFPADGAKDAFRVLVLGDSLTFGQGVSEEDSFPEVFRNLISKKYRGKKIVVFNASNPGASTEDEAKMLEDLVDKIDPNLVVVGFCDNDIRRGSVFHVTVKSRKLRSVWAFSQLLNTALINANITPDYYEDILPSYDTSTDDWKAAELALEKMSKVSSERKVPVVFLYLDQNSVRRRKYEPVIAETKTQLEEALKKNHLYFVDSHEALVADGEPSYSVSKWDDHPSERAHKIYAEVLADYVASKNFIR